MPSTIPSQRARERCPAGTSSGWHRLCQFLLLTQEFYITRSSYPTASSQRASSQSGIGKTGAWRRGQWAWRVTASQRKGARIAGFEVAARRNDSMVEGGTPYTHEVGMALAILSPRTGRLGHELSRGPARAEPGRRREPMPPAAVKRSKKTHRLMEKSTRWERQ